MKILLDTADYYVIKELIESYPIVGITTNPTILANECKYGGESPAKVLIRLRCLIGHDKELHVQLTETEYERMIEEAYRIVKHLGDNTFIKVPMSEVGLKVIKKLSD